jgi:hypothetical protein
MAEEQSTSVEHPVKPAVTGWLLFLCVLLTLLFPAASVQVLIRTLPRLISGHHPAFLFLLSVYCFVFTALAVFSFIAGLKLWLVRPGAVRLVRSWLWSYLVAHFAYFLLCLGTKPHRSAILAEMGWYHVVGPIAFFALWYFYLESSKRVRATYTSL